jgi:hypothetical protein
MIDSLAWDGLTASAFAKGFYHRPVYFRPEKFRKFTGRAEQNISQAALKAAVNPGVYRNAETTLRFVGDRGRQLTFRDLAQDPFAGSSLHLKPVRKRKTESEKIFVKHRHTDFQAFSHARGVNLA